MPTHSSLGMTYPASRLPWSGPDPLLCNEELEDSKSHLGGYRIQRGYEIAQEKRTQGRSATRPPPALMNYPKDSASYSDVGVLLTRRATTDKLPENAVAPRSDNGHSETGSTD